MSRLWDKGELPDDLVMRFTVGDDPQWDERLVSYDIRGSIAHAEMLRDQGYVTPEIAKDIAKALQEIGEEHARGEWTIGQHEEDCHTAIENRLTQRLGESAGWVHLGRSRNDQVLTTVRLYCHDACAALAEAALAAAEVLEQIARDQGEIPLPGYTHMQQAMPSSVALWAGGFASELRDDAEDLRLSNRRALKNPLGSAAGFGTPGLTLNREQTTRALGFESVHNPVTAVQLSRGKAEASIAFSATVFLQDLGRLAADLCQFASQEFQFIELPTRFTTGSSIMPQKRNPDIFELIRARSAQAPSRLSAILSITSKMTSGYHRDLQLIKPPFFRLVDEALDCARVAVHVLPHIRFQRAECEAKMHPSLYATEEAYKLVVEKGIPFRTAYREVGQKYR